jgi:two-component system, NarL family, response regulator
MQKASRIRVMTVEDHMIARRGLGAIINAHPDMTVVAEAANGQEAVAFHRKHRPDVTLMDMRLPIMTGVEAVAAIRTEFPEARFVALSTFGGDEDVHRALEAGVQSYLTKDVLGDELAKAIRAVHGGEKYLPPTIAAVLKARSAHPSLTNRELEILRLITQGMSNKQIAVAAGIATYTVNNHVKSILDKLGAEDRTQAATLAIARGIVHLDS